MIFFASMRCMAGKLGAAQRTCRLEVLAPLASRAMRTAAIAQASAALLFGLGCATLDLPRPGDIRIPPFQLKMRDLRLPSGMRVVLQEDRRMPYAAVVTVVGAGGSHDFAGKEGLAHLVEHLAFRATVTATAALSV